MQRSFHFAIVATLAVSLLLPGTASPWSINTDMGVSDRTFTILVNLKPGTERIVVAWIPALPVSETVQFVVGECYRVNDEGEPVGKHKVTFKNILLVGVDSENSVEAERSSKKIKSGVQTRRAVWELTDAARVLFSQDSSILVAGEITVSKKVQSFDQVVCGLGVTEFLDTSGFSSTASRGGSFEAPIKEVFGVDLPPLLKIPGRSEQPQ